MRQTSRLALIRATAAAALAVAVVAAPTAPATPTAQAAEWSWDAPGWGWSSDTSATTYTSPHGEHAVPAPIDGTHRAHGGGRGALGYPVAPVAAHGDQYRYQRFERGTVYDSLWGTFGVLGQLAGGHAASGGALGPVGYPTGPATSEGALHAYQTFEGGILYAGPRGSFAVLTGMTEGHASYGGGRGALGYPTSPAAKESRTHSFQLFERGVLYDSPAGRHAVTGDIDRVHRAHGGGGGALGYPLRPLQSDAPGWSYQRFSAGIVYASPHGTFAVLHPAAFAHEHHDQGGRGRLGYPTSGVVQQGQGRSYQHFERGVMYCAPAGPDGPPSCASVSGAIHAVHLAAGGGTGRYGYPRGPVGVQADGSWIQEFERGQVIVAR